MSTEESKERSSTVTPSVNENGHLVTNFLNSNKFRQFYFSSKLWDTTPNFPFFYTHRLHSRWCHSMTILEIYIEKIINSSILNEWIILQNTFNSLLYVPPTFNLLYLCVFKLSHCYLDINVTIQFPRTCLWHHIVNLYTHSNLRMKRNEWLEIYSINMNSINSKEVKWTIFSLSHWNRYVSPTFISSVCSIRI